ncbi:MAG: hypothetical protein EAZ58_13355 [Flavobacterium sp.]|nr:MAG: hypothetical protein EAZ58_13355 [Flavobacterium sp.]
MPPEWAAYINGLPAALLVVLAIQSSKYSGTLILRNLNITSSILGLILIFFVSLQSTFYK